jgi:DNA ligase-1
MRYSEIVKYYERLEATTKKLEKRDILSELYRECGEQDLERVVMLSMGVVSTELDLGIAKEMVKRSLSKAFGVSAGEVEKKFKETGDLGLAAEFFTKNKKQSALAQKILTTEKVFDNLMKLPEVAGSGSQERKLSIIVELLSSASPKEAKYIIRTIIGGMRIGVAAGIVRDAIAEAFSQDKKEIEKSYNFTGNYGKVALMAKAGRLKAEIIIGRPVRVMLAERAKDLKEALEDFENTAIEVKYDGFRIACHKDGNDIKLFSRRLDEVTKQFPEIVEMCRNNLGARSCIVEGEVLAIDKNGKPLPFQNLSRRIQRKYEIEKMIKEIPVQVNLFDIIYCNGNDLMHQTLAERWDKLSKIIIKSKRFRLAEHIETKDFDTADRFFRAALANGQEGVIVKNLDAHYQPGKRVGYWLKVKEIMEPLDLVIVGAEWGEGKRASWLGSLLLAAKAGNSFEETGMLGSGLADEQMKELTKTLKNFITESHGRTVKIKPKITVEVGYEEIQQSPKYPSGYALRFPRLLRIRDDKKPEDANTVHDIERLFRQQRKKK